MLAGMLSLVLLARLMLLASLVLLSLLSYGMMRALRQNVRRVEPLRSVKVEVGSVHNS